MKLCQVDTTNIKDSRTKPTLANFIVIGEYNGSLQITFRIYYGKRKSDLMFYGFTLVLISDYTNDSSKYRCW